MDDLFEEFINPDAYEDIEDAPQTPTTPSKPELENESSYLEFPTPPFPDPTMSSPKSREPESKEHTYPVVIDAETWTERSREQLDQIRREVDPEFINDETWGDEYYFSDQPRPLPSAIEDGSAFKHTDHSTTHRALRHAAGKKIPIPDTQTVMQHSFSQATRDIFGPTEEEKKTDQAREAEYEREIAQHFRIPGSAGRRLLERGQVIPENAMRTANMRCTLTDTNDVLDMPGFAEFCQTATFLPGRLGPAPSRNDDPAATLAYANKPRLDRWWKMKMTGEKKTSG